MENTTSAFAEDEDSDGLFGDDSDNEKNESNVNNLAKPANVPSRELPKKGRNELDEIFGSDDDGLGPLGSQEEISKQVNVKSTSSSKLYLPRAPRIPPENLTMVLKMPKFVKMETEPFYADKYDAESEQRQFGDVTAVIRWRYKIDHTGEPIKDNDGKPVMESNARLVKWSDGSYQILVGDDTFEGRVAKQSNTYTYSRELSIPPPNESEDLEMQSPQISCLECICNVQNRLTIQPSSLDSASHARIAASIGVKYKRQNRIVVREYEHTTMNPEKIQEDLEKLEAEEQKRERKRKQSLQDPDGRYRSYKRPPAMMSASYLEEGLDSQYDSLNIKSIKKGYTNSNNNRSNGNGSNRMSGESAARREMEDFIEEDDGEDDDEDEDDDWEASRRKSLAKKGLANAAEEVDDDDEDEEEDEDEDDDEEDEEEEEDEDGDDDGDEEPVQKDKDKKKKDKKHKGDKHDKKQRHRDRDRDRDRDRASNVSKEQKTSSNTTTTTEDKPSPMPPATPSSLSTPAITTAPVIATSTEEDLENNKQEVLQRKRVRRAVVESDEEDE
eukprot:gene11858-24850_t